MAYRFSILATTALAKQCAIACRHARAAAAPALTRARLFSDGAGESYSSEYFGGVREAMLSVVDFVCMLPLYS